MLLEAIIQPLFVSQFTQIVEYLFPNVSLLHAITPVDSLLEADVLLKSLHALSAYKILQRNEIINPETISESDVYLWFHSNLTHLNYMPYNSRILVVHNQRQLYLNSAAIITHAFNKHVLKLSLLYIANETIRLNFYNYSRMWSPSLRNETLRISLFHYEPMIYYNNESGFYGGLDKYLLNEILTDWNVTYVVHGSNAWHEVYADVAENRSDLGLCGFWLYSVLPHEVDMSEFYLESCYTFVIPKPTILPPSPSYIFRAFQVPLYLIFICLTLIVAGVMKMLNSTTSYGYQLLQAQQALIAVGIENLPNDIHSRIVFSAWFLTAILVSVFFATGLTQTFAFPVFTKSANSLAEMLDLKVQWLLRSPSYLPPLRNSEDPSQRKLPSLVVNKSRDVDPMYVKYADPVSVIEHFVDFNFDDIQHIAIHTRLLPTCIKNNLFVILMAKNYPSRTAFNARIKIIKESGLMMKWANSIYYDNYSKLKLMPLFYDKYPDYSVIVILSFQHLQGAFYILIVGHLLSVLIFVLEFTKNLFIIQM